MTTQPNDQTPVAERDDQQPAESKPAKAPKPKGKKEKPSKAAKPKQDAAAIGSSAADALLALAGKAGKVEGASDVRTLASKLSKGAHTRRDLVALRDAVNALSATLREANQKALAKQLAQANRAVRRLERAAR